MPKNSIEDLRNHLFEMIERIIDPEEDADMSKEIRKAQVISSLAGNIINSAKAEIEFHKLKGNPMDGQEGSSLFKTKQLDEPKP